MLLCSRFKLDFSIGIILPASYIHMPFYLPDIYIFLIPVASVPSPLHFLEVALAYTEVTASLGNSPNLAGILLRRRWVLTI